MDENKVIIEEAEHVVLDGNITDDVNEGGNFSEENCVETATDEAVSEESKNDGEFDITSEYPNAESFKEHRAQFMKMKEELADLKEKYAALLAKFDALIDGGSTIVDETETIDDEEEDESEKSLDELDFKVDKYI